jgi:hypothetical protein
MSRVLSRAEVLARRVHGKTEEVPIDDDGGIVIVRGLTRDEAHETVGKSTKESEQLALHFGVVEPEMSLADAAEWMANDESGVIDDVVKMVQRMSGEGRGKEYTKSVSGQ